MKTYHLPCSLGIPAPALVVEREEGSYSGWHTHTLECQIGTLGIEGPTPLPWNSAARAVRLTWRESGRESLTGTVTVEAHAHSGTPSHLREIADHLEEATHAWEALVSVLGPPVTGEGFLRRVGVLLGTEEATVLRTSDGAATVEITGPLATVARAVEIRENLFHARVLPDPFLEMGEVAA